MISADTLPTLALTTDASPARQAIIDDIAGNMTQARLAALVKLFRPLTGRYRITFGEGDYGHMLYDAFMRISCDRTIPKADITRRVFKALYGSGDNVRAAFGALPRAYASIIYKVLDNIYISGSSVNNIIGHLLEKFPVTVWQGSVETMFVSTDAIRGILQRVPARFVAEFFSLDTRVMRLLCGDLDCGLYRPVAQLAIASLPRGMRVFSLGDTAMQQIRTIAHVAQCPEINYFSTTGIIKPASLKVAAAMQKVDELYADGPKPMRQAGLRALVSMAHILFGCTQNTVNAKALKAAMSEACISPYALVSLACPYLESLRKAFFKGFSGTAMLRHVFGTVASAARGREESWLDVERLTLTVFRTAGEAERMMISTAALDDYGFFPPYSSIDNIIIDRNNLVVCYVKPLIHGLLLIMAWLGMLEVAVGPDKELPASPYGNLQYVRPTALGRYVLGLADSYTPATTARADESPCTLDSEHLLITAGNADAAALITGSYGEQVATGLFTVTAESFMRRVNTIGQLDSKVDTLLAICRLGELPPVWHEFVDSLRRRLSAIQSGAAGEWYIFDVDPACGGLVALLRDDARIRRLIRLVEGNSFLVLRKDFDSLADILRADGYALPRPD